MVVVGLPEDAYFIVTSPSKNVTSSSVDDVRDNEQSDPLIAVIVSTLAALIVGLLAVVLIVFIRHRRCE